jgi:hypothetical protein
VEDHFSNFSTIFNLNIFSPKKQKKYVVQNIANQQGEASLLLHLSLLPKPMPTISL